MVKAKVCGITNSEDAQASVDAGCDALGFVFYKKSPRYISPEKAKRIIRGLPGYVVKIGVFANAREKTIRRIAGLCRLDMLQLHGRETPGFCRRLNRYKIIKAFRVKGHIDLEAIEKYNTFAYLFDTFSEQKMGGTGKKFDWRLVSHIGKLRRPIFLSGGLTKENVKSAIDAVRPHWVDVSSSVETSPGKKSHKKIREFIKAAKK